MPTILRDAVTTLCHSADHLGVTIALEPGLDEWFNIDRLRQYVR